MDVRKNEKKLAPYEYITQAWLTKQDIEIPEKITVNGMRAATTSFDGKLNNKQVKIRVVAIEYADGQMYRFQLAMPKDLRKVDVEALKKSTYSFRRMNAKEKKSIKAKALRVVTAKTGDTIQTLAKRMAFDDLKVERFLALNGLKSSSKIISGRKYKIVTNG